MNDKPNTFPEGSKRGDKGFAAGNPPTVLQVLPAMGEAGGVERGTVEVAGAIVDAGGRSIVASAGGVRTYELNRVGAEHVTLPVDTKNPFAMYANVARLEKLIRDEGVDIVHARSRAPAWSAWAAARKTGAHFITTFHGAYGSANFLKRRYNHIMTRGERVIAISGFIAGFIHRVYGTPADRIRVIHRGVDMAAFSPDKVSAERVVKLANDWRLEEGLPVIMLPGRLTRLKGHGTFLDAIAKLGRDDIRFVIVGSDRGRSAYRQELVRQMERLGIGGLARVVDACNDMPAAYMLADVVVSASIEPEGFGRIVTEAQAMGRPVVATDHGGARETIIPGETGWLVPPGDADALAGALAQALGLSQQGRQVLVAKAIDNVRQHFSREIMCAKTLAVYDEVLAEGRGGNG